MKFTGALALTALLAAPGIGAAVLFAGPSAAAPDPSRVFASDCAVCHGPSGHGTRNGPDLSGVGRASLDYQLRTGRMPLVRAGRATSPGRPVVPLVGRRIDEPQYSRRHSPAYDEPTIVALVDYAADLAGGDGPDIPVVGAGSLARGGQLFRAQCAACHAWAGNGGALFHREAPGLGTATATEVAEAIRVGPGQMPVFGEAALSDEQVADVVRYVRYLDAPQDRGGFGLAHLGPVTEGATALIALGLLVSVTRWMGSKR